MRERPRPHLPETVKLGDIFNANDGVGHGKRRRSNGWRVASAGFDLRRVILSALSAQFHPRLARWILEGFQQYSLQYVYDKEMWKDGGGEEHHPTESEEFPEHPASGMSKCLSFWL